MVNPFDVIGGAFSIGSGIANLIDGKKKAKAAAAADRKALKQLQKLETFTKDDLHKKLKFGSSEDDLQKYKIGKALQLKQLGTTDYDALSRDKRINNTTSENFNAMREYRDHGMREVDKNQQEQILRDQRNQTKALQKTMMQNAVERGLDPMKTNLNARLAAAQNAAETGSRQSMQLAADAAGRRMNALSMLNKEVANDYSRKAQIAGARDRFSMANNQTVNQQSQTNWQRTNSITDQNTGLHNKLVDDNTTGELNARQGVINSRNNKRRAISNHYSNQAKSLRGQAGSNQSMGYSMVGDGLAFGTNVVKSLFPNE